MYIVRILLAFSRFGYGSSELPLPLTAEAENMHYSKPIHVFYLLVTYYHWFRQSITTTLNSEDSLSFVGRILSLLLG